MANSYRFPALGLGDWLPGAVRTAVLGCLLFLGTGAGKIFAAAPTKLGDLDGNGMLDVFDLTRLREHIRQTNPLVPTLVPFADLTQDGFVNEDDAVALINVIVGRDPARPLPLTRIRETSPYAGESGVALTREVVVRFAIPLSLNAVLTTWDANTQTAGDFYAEAGGRKLLTRVELSGDRTKATLFFLEPVPASTRVLVTFDGLGITDLLERQIDPAGDNFATGGISTFTYDTAPITPVPSTGVIGHIYASEPGPGGANVPLQHVLVRVVGSETLFTFTGADGAFSLNPCPAGQFFVEVDGRTATASHFPNGDFYPYVSKQWEALPGKADNLAAGGTGKVFLPLAHGSSFTPVSAMQETIITPPPEVIAANPAMNGVELDVPANSLFSDDGTRGGKIVIATVATNRLPEPLPPGLNHALDIAILTDGATNFDRPVPVKFPNLPDPVTGVKLKPGEKSALWSFNHDKGRWEIVGPMTVTDDGNFVATDVGVGVRQPGWHGAMPGAQPMPSPPGEPKKPDPCKISPPAGEDNYFRRQILCLRDHLCEKYKDLPDGQHIPFPKWQIDRIATNGFTAMGNCSFWDFAIFVPNLHLGCFNRLGQKHVDEELEPGFREYAEMLAKQPNADALIQQWRDEHDEFLNGPLTECLYNVLPGPDVGRVIGGVPWVVRQTARNARERAIRRAIGKIPSTKSLNGSDQETPNLPDLSTEIEALSAIKVRAAATVVHVGDRIQLEAIKTIQGAAKNLPSRSLGTYFLEDRDSEFYTIDGQGILAVRSTPFAFVNSPGVIYPMAANGEEFGFGQLIVLDSDQDKDGLADSYEKRIGLNPLIANTYQTDIDGDGLSDLLEVEIGTSPLNPDSDGDGFTDGNEFQVGSSPRNPGSPEITVYDDDYYYLLQDLTNGVVLRGVTSLGKGSLFPVLPIGANFKLTILSRDFNKISTVYFNTPNVSSAFALPKPLLFLADRTDRDFDGLADIVEEVLGTNPVNPDTDGDGISDGAEIAQGTSPFDEGAIRTGVFSSIDSLGNAKDIYAQNNAALLADGGEGVSVFDVSKALNPVRTAQMRLAGSTESVALDGTLGAATGSNLSLLDLSNLSAVRITKQMFLGGTPKVVTAAGGIAYAGLDNGQVVAVDMAAGSELERLKVAGEAIHDLSFSGDILYARTASRVYAIEIPAAGMTVSGSVAVNGTTNAPRLRLFAGGELAYAPFSQGYTILSLTDPLHPTVAQTVSTAQFGWRHVVPTGSGLGLAIFANTGNGDLHLYNFGANGRGTQFLTTFTTPGDSLAVSIYNGLAYVADGNSGLTVVNYKAYDTLGIPPTISLRTGFPTVNNVLQAEEGKLGRVTAAVNDDVQVRNVEFYVDERLVVTDGNFPFEHRFTTPLRTDNKTSFTLRAKATDTGGNSTSSPTLTINLVADATPPRVVKTLPPNGGLTGNLQTLAAVFNEPIDETTLDKTSFALLGAGPDGTFGTVDDFLPTGGGLEYRAATNTAFLNFLAVLPSSLYRLTIKAPLADLAGNVVVTPIQTQFRVFSFNDRDQDGVPDDVELLLGLNPDNPDSDGDGIRDGNEDYDNDGLVNTAEIYIGTDPRNADSNNNGILDGVEDSDGDALNNAREFLAGTDPNKADTDGDGWNDETEVTGGSSPTDPKSRPIGLIVAAPGVFAMRQVAIGEGSSGSLAGAAVVAAPVVYVARYDSSPGEQNWPTGIIQAQPPITIARPVANPGEPGNPGGGLGGATFIAPPGVRILKLDTSSLFLAQPPIVVEKPSQ